MIISLWMWCQGYVTVRVSGFGLESFLSRAAAQNIPLWSVKRPSQTVLLVRVGVRQFSQLRTLLWDTQVSIRILDRHGLPFLMRRLKMRMAFGFGLLGTVLLMAYFSRFIWFVEISGHQTIDIEQIKQVIAGVGVQTGVLRNNLDRRELEHALLTSFPAVVWANLSVHGVKAIVTIVEHEQPSVEFQKEAASEIRAEKSGLITDMQILRGTPSVKVGDTVRQGDLLIAAERASGLAQGMVYARVWYHAVGEASFTSWDPLQTGKVHRQYLFTVGNWTIPLGKSYQEENYVRQAKRWCVSLGSALLPIRWTKVEYFEVEYVLEPVSLQQAKIVAKELAWEQLLAQGLEPEQVLQEKSEEDVLLDGNGIQVRLLVEVEEEIGRLFGQ